MSLKIKGDCVVALFLMILTLGICVLKMTESFRMVDDSAAYVSQAIALTQGTTSEFIADSVAMIGKYDLKYMTPTTYPWGFPMLLAPIYKIFGFNIVAFKSVGVICYTIFVGIFYIFCVNRLPRIYAILAVLFFALNPYMTNFAANEIFSDMPFLLFGFITLITLAKLFGESRSNNNGILIAIFGGIFMLFATMIRINGFVILCALITMHGILILKRFAPKIFTTRILKPFSLIDSPYSWQIHAIPYVVFIIGFALVSLTLSSGTSRHWDYLANISLQSILCNLSLILPAWFIPLNTGIDSLLLWLCVPFILLGIYANIRPTNANKINENIFYVIFILGFFALLLLWVEFDIRFVFLILPFLIFWCAKGFTLIGKKLFSFSLAMLIIVILLNLAWINVRDILFIKSNTNPDDAYSPQAREIYDYIINQTPKDSTIISFKPRVFYLNTARFGFVSNDIKSLDKADFVVWNGRYTNDLPCCTQDISLPEFQSKTQLIFQNAEYKLFKVLK